MSGLVFRSGDDKHIAIKHLDMQVFFDELFDTTCKTAKDVEWLTEQLTSYLERASEEKMEDFSQQDKNEEES